MKIVIQCAATKHSLNSEDGLRSKDNLHIKFVADPQLINITETTLSVTPDEIQNDSNKTWRDYINTYNKIQKHNPCKLFPAYKLYKHPIYTALVEKFGIENIFILSAGWGLISADFLTPEYDITFSNAKNVHPSSKRKKEMTFQDFCHLTDDDESIIFFGGKDYLPLFCKLTLHSKAKKIVFFNSIKSPVLPSNFHVIKYETTQKTNWHYSCARDFIDGKLLMESS
jgi:hypothetical protein